MELAQNLIYSLNVVTPIFLLVFLGWLLKRKKVFSDKFFSSCDKFVFRIALPSMIFLDVSTTRIKEVSEYTPLIVFCGVSLITAFIIGALIVPLFIHDKAKVGAFVQGIARANFAILGIPIAYNMFGEDGTRLVSILLPEVILIGNILVVIILSVFNPKCQKTSKREMFFNISKSIIKNPLIIAVIIALPFMFIPSIELPIFAERTLSYLSDATMSLALISLGACITIASFKGRFLYSITATVIRLVFLPLIAVMVAWLLGFSGMQISIIFLLFGVPTAVSSYIMAKQMDSDYELAGLILLFTTLFGVFTLFLGVFLIKTVGWI